MTKSTKETLDFLRHENQRGATNWGALCLKLQRTARGIPAMFPTALAAANGTPRDHRFYELDQVTRGMVAYFDDPRDSNPYGHITCVAGRDEDGELLHWTNDASGRGRVSLVRHSFFRQYWGDQFSFAADWLNGQDLPLPQKKVKPAPKPSLGVNLQNAIESIDKAIAYHKRENHPVLVKALQRDRRELVETRNKYGAKR